MSETVRSYLDALIAKDFSSFPAEDQASIAALAGVSFTPNNLLDDPIDVQEFVADIEALAYKIDSFFLAQNNIAELEAYLEANNTTAFNSLRSSTALAQAQIDLVFANAAPQWFNYFGADLATLWEGISGVTTAMYSAVVAAGGGLKNIFGGADDAFDNLVGESFETAAEQLGVSPQQVIKTAEVVQFLSTLVQVLNSMGDRASDLFTDPGTTSASAFHVGMLQDLNALQSAFGDVQITLGELPLVPAPLQAVFDLMSLVANIQDTVADEVTLQQTRDDTNLEPLSRDFLDDAVLINATEVIDQMTELLRIGLQVFPGGAFAGMVSFWSEGIRTLSDVYALQLQSGWRLEANRFADYDALDTIVATYQNALSNALTAADSTFGGTWGTNLASTEPSQPLAAIGALQDRYDTFGEGGSFESGGALTLGQSYSGEITFLDKGDWFAVDLTSGRDYRFEVTEGTITDGDILIYDAVGRLYARENASKTTNTEWVIEGSALESGTYFVVVESSRSGTYSIDVSEVNLPDTLTELPDAPNDIDTPYALTTGETFHGNMNLADDDYNTGDWVRVELVAGQDYRFEVARDTIYLGDIVIYDAVGRVFARENASKTVADAWVIEGTATTSGTFYAAVESRYSGSYALEFSNAVLPDDVTEMSDAPNDIYTPYAIAVGETFHGNMNTADDDYTTGDWVRVDLAAGQDYRISVAEQTISGGDVLLFDADGREVGRENSALTNNDTWVMQGTALRSGAYFIGIESNFSGSYTISVDAVSLPDTYTELEDALADASTRYLLAAGETFLGTMNIGDQGPSEDEWNLTDKDWIAVDLVAGQDYRFEVMEGTLGSGEMTLVDASGAVMANSLYVGGQSGTQWFMEGTALETGRYYVAIESGTRGTYHLSFDAVELPTTISELWDAPPSSETPYALALGDSFAGVLNTADKTDDAPFGVNDRDWLRVEMQAGQTYAFEMNKPGGTSGDLNLYDASGALIANTSSPLPNSTTWLLQGTAAATGTYFLEVYGRFAFGEYTLDYTGNLTLTGGFGDDLLVGSIGDDSLSGGFGDDTLIGQAGDDLLDGGVGEDTVSYESAAGRVVVRLNLAADVGSGEGVDTFVSIENVIGSAFGDRITGDAGANFLQGGAGDDVLIGLGGDDVLDGQDGDDELIGSGGNDILYGGPGNDVLRGLGGADQLNGDGGDDTLYGDLGVDTISGDDGNDDIFGLFGVDTILGGAGNDNIRADGSGDIVSGGDGNDRMVGGNGKDYLWGGKGNDVYFGGGGHGNGDGLRDIFVFKSAANGGGGFDIIRDFEDTKDKIDLSESVYTNFADLLADATQNGAHVDINFDGSGILRIENFLLSDFTSGDVIF